MKLNYSMEPRRLIYLAGFCLLLISRVCHSELACQVQSGRINDIRIGDPIDKVYTAFEKDFVISEFKPPRTVRYFTVSEKSTQKKWFDFTVDKNYKIIIVDIQGPCFTKEGIGVGSTLDEATKTYGRPLVGPTNAGYEIGFAKIPGVTFILNDEDIPK